MLGIRRREFITLLGGAAAAWPAAVRAQPLTAVVGFLGSETLDSFADRVRAFHQGLGETEFIEGKNASIEFRWANNQYERLPALAADLVRQKVAVIATPGSTPATLAAKAATTTIPIVFGIGADPIALGLVASLNRPGGNITGVSFQTVELVAKRLGLLHELAPAATRFIALVNPKAAFSEAVIASLQRSALYLRLPLEILYASTAGEIEAAFANFVQKPGSALLVSPDPFFADRRVQLVTLAARHALPTVYFQREFSDIGGLMSYGPNIVNVFQQTGVYVGRILKGEKPADLPVQQPTKFALVINLSTARALGIAIPNTLLALADEVIE
jgi:putative ABC transport system substrate-binding protein